MKVKEFINLDVLISYGFEKIDKEQEEKHDQWTIACYDYKYLAGISRRGQCYYLLIKEETRDIIIYATEPDGSGGTVKCPDVLMKLVHDGFLC